jgi:hypothetical protein
MSSHTYPTYPQNAGDLLDFTVTSNSVKGEWYSPFLSFSLLSIYREEREDSKRTTHRALE